MVTHLQELTRSYSRLDDALLDYWDSDTRQQVPKLLARTIDLQAKLEQALTDSLAAPV